MTETLSLLMDPSIRVYQEAFHTWNFVRIPAIAHGFDTSGLLIDVYNDNSERLMPILRISPQTFLVEIIFAMIEWDPDTGAFTESLMRPQSGTVVMQTMRRSR